jgi:Na+/H+ antiporter
MLHNLPFYLLIIFFITLLIIFAQRIKIAYPIILVLGGLALSFSPYIPEGSFNIDHELIFLIFLPPLLYEAAWYTSWKEFWRFRRIISSFAFLIVIATSMVVALAANYYIPGFTLALGFLLGAIVSPPDAVSAGAVMKFVKVPKSLNAIIEGESLLNDASSLIVFRFALLAVSTGQFVLQDAAIDFVWVIGAGIAVGLAVGYLFYFLHTKLPTDVNTDIVFTLIAPYVMYIAAESIHVSGVLAVVTGGLFLSSRQHLIMNNSSRLRSTSVWSALGFVLNGLVFMLIGLQLPSIVNDINGISLKSAIWYGVLITFVLVVSRLMAAFGAVYFSKFIGRFIRTAGVPSNFKAPLIFGWAGMRGVVSLAAALSIPPVIAQTGMPFPQRNLILFITFVVILLTLITQGLTLPWLIKFLKLADNEHQLPEHIENKNIHIKLANYSLKYLNDNFAEKLNSHPVLKQMATRWENTEWLLENEIMHCDYKNIYIELLNQQRAWLNEWNKEFFANEDVIRRHLVRLDLEEEKLKFN